VLASLEILLGVLEILFRFRQVDVVLEHALVSQEDHATGQYFGEPAAEIIGAG